MLEVAELRIMLYIPTIKPLASFNDAEIMFRRYFRNRNITFDKTMWMEWNEKVKFCILVIKFLKTYYYEYEKIHQRCSFVLKNSFSLKGKSIEIREVYQYGMHSGYEFHLSTFWNYEIGVGAQNTRSGKFDLYVKAEDWFRDFLFKMYEKLGEQASNAILNMYKPLCDTTLLISI